MKEKTRNRQEALIKQGKKDQALPANSKASLDKKLDEGLDESFPASDPVSVKITK